MVRRRIVWLLAIGFWLGGVAMGEVVKVENIAKGFKFPEGPVWHPDGFLLFSDIHDAKIIKILPGGGTEPWFDEGKKTNGLIMSNDGTKIYACCYSERELLEIDARTKKYRVLARDPGGRELNNVNDVAVDAEGNIYFTDPKWGAKRADIQGVYAYTKTGDFFLAAKLDEQPNGLVISPDQKWLYVGRSGGNDIWRFARKGGGKLGEGERWVKLEPKAEPDGMTIDREGNLYVAQAGNGKVCVLSPGGETLRYVEVFNRMATNCEFEGGSSRILYVTGGGSSEEARTGAVYKLTFP